MGEKYVLGRRNNVNKASKQGESFGFEEKGKFSVGCGQSRKRGSQKGTSNSPSLFSCSMKCESAKSWTARHLNNVNHGVALSGGCLWSLTRQWPH